MLRRLGRTFRSPLNLLLLLTVLELVVYRVAVSALQVKVPQGQPIPVTPLWHAALGWLGVFLHYFIGTLAIGLLVVRATRAALGDGGGPRVREIAIAVAAALVAMISALALVVGEEATTGFILETALALAIVVGLAVSIRRGNDLGAMIGLGFMLLPFAVHYYGVLAGQFVWSEEAADLTSPTGKIKMLTRTGVSVLCLAAIASPYCFGPRPLARAVIRIPPVVAAMGIAAVAALITRNYYPDVVKLVRHATGVPMMTEQPDPQRALYILSFATLCWTLVSCMIADAAARRRLGLGLALVVLGGYHEVVWPAYYAVITVGWFTIVDAIPELRPAERVERITVATPPVEDRIWQTWVTTLVGGLRGAGHHVHALTARGDEDAMTTVVSGDVAHRPFRMRIERIGGSVVVVDARFGRDLGDQPATFTLQARPEGLRDTHPEPPAAGPRFELGDAAFDGRFKVRGDKVALAAALDDGIRARLTATMDGWLAVWDGESVRLRIYPGRGAPIDHPIPLSDLAIRRAGPDAADRLITTISVLADVATRILPPSAHEVVADDDDELPPPAAKEGDGA